LDILLLIKKYGIFVVFIIVGYVLFQFQFDKSEKISIDEIKVENMNDSFEKQEEEVTNNDEIVYVDVKGAVHHPGVYQLKATDRVMTAIEKAGGLKENADTKHINLAAIVEDGSMIYIPTKEETQQSIHYDSLQHSSTPKININKATVEELQNLTGIGPQKAKAIIAYRQENGPFQSIEDIMNVTGIGEKSFEKIKDDISVQ